MPNQNEKAKVIKQRYKDSWLAMEGVTAVGIGQVDVHSVGIVISVKGNPDRIRNRIPQTIEGIPIKIQETGEIRAF